MINEVDQTSARKPENITYAFIFALISYFSVATMGVFVKLLPSEIDLSVTLFIQFFVSFILVSLLVLPKKNKHLATEKPSLHVLRIIAGVLTFGLFFLSLRYINLVNAIVLRSTTPFFIPLILFFWKGQKISFPVGLAIILGFVGVFLIIKPSFHHINIGMLFALGSGFVMAIAALVIRRLNRTERGDQALFYYFLGSSILLLPFFLYDIHNFYSILTIKNSMQLIIIGILMFTLQYTLVKAFSYGKPSLLGPIAYTAILFSGLYDWFIWGNLPDYLSIIGISFIVLTTLIILVVGAKQKPVHD